LRFQEARQLKHRLVLNASSNSESSSSSNSDNSSSAMEISYLGEEASSSSSSSSTGKTQGVLLPDGTAIDLPPSFLQADGGHLLGSLTGILFGGSPYASTLDPHAVLASNFPPALDAPASLTTGGVAGASAMKPLPDSKHAILPHFSFF
jgi:hypothetical protein